MESNILNLIDSKDEFYSLEYLYLNITKNKIDKNFLDIIHKMEKENKIEIKKINNTTFIKAVNDYKIISTFSKLDMNEKNIIKVKSETHPNKEYEINIVLDTCSCPDFTYRNRRCKHLKKINNIDMNYNNYLEYISF